MNSASGRCSLPSIAFCRRAIRGCSLCVDAEVTLDNRLKERRKLIKWLRP